MQEAKPPVDSAARAKPHMIAMVLVLHFTNEFASAAKAKGAFLVAPSTDIRMWQQALQTLFDRNAEAHQICSAFFEPKATAPTRATPVPAAPGAPAAAETHEASDSSDEDDAPNSSVADCAWIGGVRYSADPVLATDAWRGDEAWSGLPGLRGGIWQIHTSGNG